MRKNNEINNEKNGEINNEKKDEKNNEISDEKKNEKKYRILGIVALVLALVIEFILVKSNTFSQFAVGNVLAIFGIVVFVGLHFVIGIKKLYNYIIDNRYIISIVLIIASTIIGYMQNNIGIKEWILSTNIPLCLWWNIKFFALVLASYEFMLIITNNRNIAIIASFIISFSGAIQWNFEYINSIIIGEIVIVLLNNLIDSKGSKIINSCFIVILSFLYMQTTSSFAITFAYIWLALIIWSLIKNKKKLKGNKIYIFGVLVASIIAIIISLKYIDFGFKYDPIETTRGASYLFTYIYNILLPFTDMEKAYLYGNFISLFPIPMLVALYYMYKSDVHVEFLLPITIVAVLETIFCISGFPKALNQILGFDNISVVRCSVAVNYANLLLLLYIISNIDEIFKIKVAIKLTLVSVCILAFIGYPAEFSSRNYIYLFAAELCILFLLFYNYGNKKYTKVLLFFMLLFTLTSGIFVNPIVSDKAETISAPIIIEYEN